MAFFRNHSNEPGSHGVLEDKGHGQVTDRTHTSAGNDEEDMGTDKEFNMNMDAPYHSGGQVDDSSRFQNEPAADDGIAMRVSNLQNSGRRTAVGRRWGSTFWKDCQPMIHGGSDSAQESKSESDNRSGEGSEDNLSNEKDGGSEFEDDDQIKEGKDQRRYTDVTAEDGMLSDEYYEQDGDEQSDSLPYRGFHNSVKSNRLQSQSQSVNANSNHMRRNSRVVNDEDDDDGYDEDHNDDADYEEDEEEEDDPDDVDFEPDYGVASGRSVKKDKDWDGEDYEEDDGSDDDDLEISDDEGPNYGKKGRGKQRGKGVRNVKSTSERKPYQSSIRQRKGKFSYEEDESSMEDSASDSVEAFKSSVKTGTHLRKNSGRYSVTAGVSGRRSEVRTSSRSVRKVSYVESEESEEFDEGKKKKSQKEEVEEEDGDAIEKVLWHQPKGTAEDAIRNNRPIDPVLSSHSFDSEPDWNEVEFLIKWKGQSHLHCQWKPFSELQYLSGFKKVLNYTKKVMDEIRYRKSVSREEIEVYDVSKEMDLDLIKQNSQVERVIADRISKDGSGDVVPEYLVKWQGLSYAEATWEKDVDISFAQDAIDEYKAREAAISVQGKSVDLQRKKSKVSLRKLDEQPEWLMGGKLRDYQLEGLNFLVNSWRNDTNVILADEMGLGKTVQSVSMLGFLQNAQQIYGPFLVVVPLSTLSNWAKEFRKWLPDMNVIVYVGTRASRERDLTAFEFPKNIFPGNFFTNLMESCPAIKSILLLDSEGKRVAVKYYSDDWPTNSAKEAFEKSVFIKTQKTNARTEAEIAMFESNIVVYKFAQDLHFFVTGGEDENELILASVLQGFFDAVGILLRGNVEKKEALENLDLILLCLDEIIDGGIVLETDANVIAGKVASHSIDSNAPLSEQTISQALATAREHLARSLLK